MKYKIAYEKFISGEKISRPVFVAAREYLTYATVEEKRAFAQRMDDIVFSCMNKIIDNSLPGIEAVKDVYSSFGISDSAFKKLFEQKLNTSDNPIVRRFKEEFTKRDASYREIYEEAKRGFWQNDCLKEIAKKRDISTNEVKNVIKNYVFNVLKMDNVTFNRMKDTYRSFMEYGTQSKKRMVNCAIEYFETWATCEERNYFANKIAGISSIALAKLNVSYDYFKQYLNSINVKESDFIYLNKTLYLKELNTLIELIGKYLYELGVKHQWQNQALKEVCKTLAISFNDFKFITQHYAENFLGKSNDTNNQKSNKSSKQTKYPKYVLALDKILETDDEDKIFSLFKTYNILPIHVYNYCHYYQNNSSEEKQQELETKLLAIYKNYLSYLPRNSQGFAKYYIDYLQGNVPYRVFCKRNNIVVGDFKENLVSFVHLSYKDEVRARIEADDKIELDRWVELSNAISTADEKWERPFDLIDYFIYFGDLAELYQHMPKIFASQMQTVLNIFFSKFRGSEYINFEYINKEAVINGYVEVMTPTGDKKILTKEELAMIITFLEQNNVPLYDTIMNMAIRRYVNNTLFESYNRQAD